VDHASAVSETGVVAGRGREDDGPQQAVVWSPTDGAEFLGAFDPPPAYVAGHAYGVSSDGAVAVGWASVWNNSATTSMAFRWTAGAGMVALVTLGSATFSTARGVSSDGSVVVGESGSQAFRWTEAGGMFSLGWGAAHAVSGDGAIVVGSRGLQPTRWSDAGYQLLGDLPGGSIGGIAKGISPDGSVIVGWSYSAAGTEAFRWTQAEGMEGLGDLPGGGFVSVAADASAGGSVIVGHGRTDAFPNEAFVWTPTGGMRLLAEVLETEHGLDLQGWVLREAHGVSADGRRIVGWGTNPDGATEAWMVVLPPACSNGVDDDGDGRIDHPEDPGCRDAEGVSETSQCQDGLDNDAELRIDFDGGASLDRDGDGFVDAAYNPATPAVGEPDPHCAGRPWRNREGACGLGVELALVLAALRARKRDARTV
jgi:probable HAF family extracellular repeat protein